MKGSAVQRSLRPLRLARRGFSFLARFLLGPRVFQLAGHSYRYLVHPSILDNERTVELPIVLEAVRQAKGMTEEPKILELGDVLGAFDECGHLIVDKYKAAPGISNIDIIDFKPPERFDLIVSISTLEHIGYDENPRQERKALRAFSHLRTLLAPGGRLLVTLPIGYNPALDQALRLGAFPSCQTLFMERCGRFNQWRECDARRALGHRFGSPYPSANSLAILSFRAEH